MTPVISPWIFYIMPVCEKFSILAWVIFGVSLFALAVVACFYFSEGRYMDDDEIRKFKRILKRLIVAIVITAILGCFIPTEETIVKMIVSQNVTYERVDVVTDTVANVYNDIMNLFRDSGAANG